MKKILNLPFYVPVLGILISFAMIIINLWFPMVPLLIAGMVLLHVSGWLAAIRFFVCGFSMFSVVLSSD